MPPPANVPAPAPQPEPTLNISEDANKVAAKLQREALERIEKGSAELDELFVKSWKCVVVGRNRGRRGVATRRVGFLNRRVPHRGERVAAWRGYTLESTVNLAPGDVARGRPGRAFGRAKTRCNKT